ncbi:hypothetical protein ACFVWY_05620 [Streptomyces sp. NPDC058195]|uniref:hypothetical protein n=1 Tax=Streptomyces sp. NPDC058195 TaxID=3346375 RepID=UPI0036DFF860
MFSPAQLRRLADRFDLIDVHDDEARAVQVNVLAITPGTVVASGDRIADQPPGIEILTVDYSEVTQIPGSLYRTILPLNRS